MMENLPVPLVSADVDLKGFPYTPIFRGRLFASSFHAKVSDAAWRAGVTLWLKSWEQVPAGSLPDDEVELCRLAELGRDVKAWRKIAKEAMWGWFKCSDGRMHHKTVAEGVTEAWGHRQAQRDRTAKARATRASQRGGNESDNASGDKLNAVTTGTVTGSVTEIVEPPSQHPTEAKRSEAKKDNLEPAAPYDPAGAAASLDLARARRLEPIPDGGTDEFRRTQAACIEALGGSLGDGGIAPADGHFGPLMALIDQGAPLAAVLTALRSLRARPPKSPIKTWGLFALKVSEAIAANPKLLVSGSPLTEGTTNITGIGPVPTANVKRIVAGWARGGPWHDAWGDAPGGSCCFVPESFLGPVICLAGVDRHEVVVERVVAIWRRDGRWPDGWGPAPDDPDCAVPVRLRPELEPV